ncbi:hypothetical protein EV589_3198 [Mycobacterium sp. BK558]|nr:hypothetical protein EV589_3198 [Mycobacterium sp. BK558]
MSKVPASAITMISSLESRLVRTKLLVIGVIGLCVGALIGGLAFGAMSADTTATAFLRLQNPADLTAIASGANQVTPDNQSNTGNFVAGEIAYLSGDGFAQAVGRKMALDEPPELNIAQANESAVVSISYSTKTSDDAIRTVQTAIDLYQQDLAQRVDAQLRRILPMLSEWQQRDTADAARMQELQRVREAVQLQADQSSTVQIVQPPTPNHPSSQQWLIGAFLGGLIGASLALAVPLVRRRRSGRGSMVQTVTDGVDAVLLPAVDLHMPDRDGWTDHQFRLARTLYSQCPTATGSGAIVVAGASPESGAAVVAALLEAAVADAPRADALSGQHSTPTDTAPTSAHVVLGGVVGDATLSPEVITSAASIVLVSRLDHDTSPQVLALQSVAAAGTAPVLAVFTHRRLRIRGDR